MCPNGLQSSSSDGSGRIMMCLSCCYFLGSGRKREPFELLSSLEIVM